MPPDVDELNVYLRWASDGGSRSARDRGQPARDGAS
jgi:hypothetical protein